MENNSQSWNRELPVPHKSVINQTWLTALTAVWLLLLGTGFSLLLFYQHDAGERLESHLTWPKATLIQREESRCQLMLFLHPQCACSLATLNELARLQSTCQDRLAIEIVIYHPTDAAEDWFQSPNVELVKNIRGAKWISDPDGTIAREFGVLTSGHALLYSPTGALIFSGGITPSRAHEGDNLGRQAIVRYVCLGEKTVDQTNVFGCPLFGSPARETETVQPRKSPDVAK